jgi:hypothetical protein
MVSRDAMWEQPIVSVKTHRWCISWAGLEVGIVLIPAQNHVGAVRRSSCKLSAGRNTYCMDAGIFRNPWPNKGWWFGFSQRWAISEYARGSILTTPFKSPPGQDIQDERLSKGGDFGGNFFSPNPGQNIRDERPPCKLTVAKGLRIGRTFEGILHGNRICWIARVGL